ncbi:MAG TPA: tRNA-uridine aminocarboxypropyltransferase [Polyangiaceae bacterium]
MSRRKNAYLRCKACLMHPSLCVCSLVPRLETKTKLLLVIHRIEKRKPSNTGRLGADCLVNSEILVRGHEETPTPPFVPAPSTQPLFLYPAEDAIPITRFADSPVPCTLIVPDGTWRQASKVRYRVPGFKDVPCVSLPPDVPSIYRLRSEAHAHGLATVEAIARAFGILEGPVEGPKVRSQIERVFQAMVDRTLWSRGELDDAQVTGGVPEGAMRHDPLSGTRAADR